MNITIINEDNNFIYFDYNDNGNIKHCKISKEKDGWSCGDTRWLMLNNVMYDGIGFDVTDGYAVSNGICKTNQYSNPNGYCMGNEININENINDKIEVYFPTIKEILSNEKLLEEGLYYSLELGEGKNHFIELAEKGYINASFFFEGFFFGGCTSNEYKHFVNGKRV